MLSFIMLCWVGDTSVFVLIKEIISLGFLKKLFTVSVCFSLIPVFELFYGD